MSRNLGPSSCRQLECGRPRLGRRVGTRQARTVASAHEVVREHRGVGQRLLEIACLATVLDVWSNLAAEAFKAGLVDECQLLVYPVFVGAGKSSLPRDMRADLELLDERRFGNGVVYLRDRVVS